MATNNYYIVKKGDTLSEIAQKYGIGTAAAGWLDGAQELQKINKIYDIDYIVVGQKILLYGDRGPEKTNNYYVTIKSFGLQSKSERGMYVSWAWTRENTEGFEILWQYKADGQWWDGTSTNLDLASLIAAKYQSMYTAPDNASAVRVKILPFAKKKSANGSAVYWTAKSTQSDEYSFSDNPPEAPSAPKIELEDLKLTASLSNLDSAWQSQGVRVEFQLVRNNKSVVDTAESSVKTGYASASWKAPTITTGSQYKVRCRAKKEVGDNADLLYSPWSAYTENVDTKPGGAPTITKCQASKAADGSNDICVYLEWKAVNTADSYTVQYSTDEKDFEYNSAQEATVSNSTKYKTPALTDGGTYYFRVQGSNANGETEWSEISEVTVGDIPAAPTTWSSKSSVVAGTSVTLYWIHNARDNSDETFADLKIYINGVEQMLAPVENEDIGAEDDGISSYVFETDGNDDGMEIRWKVRTAGATQEYGDWSEERVINVFASPTLDLTLTDRLGNTLGEEIPVTAFPLYVNGIAAPASQVPIGYHISIISNQMYETLDSVGNVKMVSEGEEIYSRFFDISEPLLAELSASDVDFSDKCSYTLRCTVAMDSGLDAEASVTFDVSWTDEDRWPNAEIGIDRERLVAYIRPYCDGYRTEYREVVTNILQDTVERVVTEYVIDELSDATFVRETLSVLTSTGEGIFSFEHPETGDTVLFCIIDNEYKEVVSKETSIDYDGSTFTHMEHSLTGNSINLPPNAIFVKSKYAQTTTGEDVFFFKHPETGHDVSFCQFSDVRENDDVLLSVYRREFDGTYTELATGIDPAINTHITDPHPSLDYARYRIVATQKGTGAISFVDTPPHEVGEKSVVIQWDEAWSSFNASEDAMLSEAPWSGSMLKLPYNIDVSDSFGTDNSLIKYIGRKYPVSYYGTQLDSSSTWNVEIPKTDKETLYALRRLAIWTGDVYVREPSGSGYWANISVSFSQKHRETTIPVTFNIKRVEGGA